MRRFIAYAMVVSLFAIASNCLFIDDKCDSSDVACSGGIVAGLISQFEPAPTATTPIPDPLPVTGPGLWFLSAYGLTETSGQITTWGDQSGNGFDAFAVGAGAILKTSAINSQPALTFDGTSSNYILGSNYPFTSASDGGVTAFVVCRSDHTDNGSTHFVFDFGFLASDGYGLRYSSDGGGVAEGGMYTPSSHGGASTTFDVTETTADFVILSFRIEFGVEQRLYLNGTSRANAAITTTALDATTIREAPTRAANAGGPFSIGWQSKNGDNTRTFKGDIAELILYHSALTDGDRQAIECYLSNKYGISVPQTCS